MRFVLFCFSLLMWMATAATPAGYVLEQVGAWHLDGDAKPLVPGAALPGGAAIKNDHPKDGDRLVVADAAGGLLKNIQCAGGTCHECKSADSCEAPLQPLPANTSPLDKTFGGVMARLVGAAERYAYKRAPGEELADAVITVDQDHADLAPVVFQLGKGTYSLRWRDLTQPKAKPVTGTVDVAPGRPAVVAPVPPVGLYACSVVEKGKPEAKTAWVLLVSPAQSLTATAEFQRAMARTTRWGVSVSPETRRAYLRASLDEIARQMADKR